MLVIPERSMGIVIVRDYLRGGGCGNEAGLWGY